jgi:hypothetical protein
VASVDPGLVATCHIFICHSRRKKQTTIIQLQTPNWPQPRSRGNLRKKNISKLPLGLAHSRLIALLAESCPRVLTLIVALIFIGGQRVFGMINGQVTSTCLTRTTAQVEVKSMKTSGIALLLKSVKCSSAASLMRHIGLSSFPHLFFNSTQHTYLVCRLSLDCSWSPLATCAHISVSHSHLGEHLSSVNNGSFHNATHDVEY